MVSSNRFYSLSFCLHPLTQICRKRQAVSESTIRRRS